MSIANPGLRRNVWWKSQPYKGLFFMFNMWPFAPLAQPLKGIVASITSLVITIALYSLTVSLFDQDNIIQGLYWWFNILWVQVFLMAPGLYDGIGLWQEESHAVESQPLS